MPNRAQFFEAAAKAFVFVSAWVSAWLVLTAELYMIMNSGTGDRVRWELVAFGQGIRVLLWMPVTFVVVWAFRRWPFNGPSALRSCLKHLALSIALMLAIHVLRVLFVTAYYQDWEFAHVRLALVTTFNGLRVTDISIYWAIVGILALKAYSERELVLEVGKERLQSSLAEAELRALKYQLKPHFVFNSLNAVSALIREERYAKAIDTLADLSVLMRTMSDAPAHDRIPLEQEIAFIERQLSIEQVRFSDKLQVALDVPAELARALVPNLVLQPLVENAVKHGISRRLRPGRITVRASTTADGTQLRLQVINDGPAPRAQPNGSVFSGVGLSATHSRLQHLYGARFQLKLDLEREDDASVEIIIPLEFSPS